MRREQNNVVSEWARASFALLRVAVGTEALQTIATTAVAAAMLFSYMSRHSDSTGVLLVIYWALNLPLLGNVVADSARQYPATHNVAMRLSEIITAPEAPTLDSPRVAMSSQRGMAIVASEIGVQAAGHTILHNVTFRISPGEHVAIVGRSGAGKSTLLSLLLGWNEISTGSLKVDGEPLDPARLFQISSEIAWVDPAIHLWNRSFLQNITYGSPGLDPSAAASLVRQAELLELLQALPDGLQTPLGEGGGVVSGGEGQRVRLARAMCRKDARLVLLDEPFRGLDGASRRRLLVAARNHWSAATLLCVTHDIRETRTFDRVLVVADGAIVEDDRPEDLAARASSVYARLLGAETAATANVWGAHPWRRVRVERGTISEG
jgi:ATP-binding cassette subfamily B protein